MAAKKTTAKKKTSNSNSARSAKSNSTAKKSTVENRSTRSKTPTASDERYNAKREDMKRDVSIFAVLAVSLVLAIGNFGGGGAVLQAISGFFFGLFGLFEYALPFVAFGMTLYFFANRNNTTLRLRVISFIVFIVFLCIFFEFFNVGFLGDVPYNPGVAFVSGRETAGQFALTGGLIGGLFVSLLKGVGMVAGLIISAAGMIIAFIMFTGLTPWTAASERFSENMEDRRTIAEAKRAKKEIERENRRRENLDNKLRGVTMDTTIVEESANDSEQMREIDPNDPRFQMPVDKDLVASTKNGSSSDPMLGKYASSPEVKTVKIDPVIDKIAPNKDEDLYAKLQENMGEIKKPDESTSKEVVNSDSDMPVLSPKLQQKFAEKKAETVELTPVATEPEETIEEGLIDEFKENTKIEEIKSESEIKPMVSDIKPVKVEPVSVAEVFEEPIFEEHVLSDEHIGEIEDTVTSVPEHRAAPVIKNPAQSEEEKQEGVDAVAEEIEAKQEEVIEKPYIFPTIDLLTAGKKSTADDGHELEENAVKLQQTLKNFGVNVTVEDVVKGPTVTRFEIKPEMGTKVQKIVNLTDDLRLNLAATDIRIEAPIPGKAAIGIEIPNKTPTPVMFRDLVESEDFKNHKSPIAFGAGMDIDGNIIMADIAKMPHLLIAGTTGSGKSVCINSIIMSILYKADPKDVKLIMIDPKMVELNVYNGIPHLLIPVVTDAKKAAGALNWAVAEMMDRYEKFKFAGVRDLAGYNEKMERIMAEAPNDKSIAKLPKIVIVVDEFADLMMVAPGDVEEAVCRIAQLARACGIHLILATQRPTANVITGLIKANVPSRIAFAVASGTDSRIVLDQTGAERLLGHGDMLYFPQGASKPTRSQGAFVPDADVFAVTDFIKENMGEIKYDEKVVSGVEAAAVNQAKASSSAASNSGDTAEDDSKDEYFERAARIIMEKEKASIGVLQRALKVGFNRAARIMDQLEEAGVVGPESGTKPREILMTTADFDRFLYQTDEE